MISIIHRFHGHGALNYLYKNGKIVRGQAMALRYVSNARREHYRVAVVVSRKVSKSAVVRNRIRRRLYECIRLQAGEFTGVYDFALLIYDASLADMPAEKLTKEVVKLLQKASIISGKPVERAIVKP